MNKALALVLGFFLCIGAANAQVRPLPVSDSSGSQVQPLELSFDSLPAADLKPPSSSAPVALVVPPVLPRMAPELALEAVRGRAVVQAARLASYSATTVIHAQLPDMSQQGEFELQKQYSSPRTLAFKAVSFTGDNFVKSNVIVRLLQAEVDHVQKDDPAQSAITPANYHFSYKGTAQLDGRQVHVYQVKPHHKRAGLFKGHVYLDAYTGSMVRAEGRMVKSPSFFVKKIEFVQDYADISDFTLPVHIHSEAKARLVGRTIVDVYDRDYQPVAVDDTKSPGPAL